MKFKRFYQKQLVLRESTAHNVAGILLYKQTKSGRLKVFLAKPHNRSSWSIPKGQIDENESIFDAARREFEEETGLKPKRNERHYLELEPYKGKNQIGYRIWAIPGEAPQKSKLRSVMIKKRKKSGKVITTPEIEEWGMFDYDTAMKKIAKNQRPILKQFKRNLTKKK